MYKEIENLINAEVSRSRENLVYQLIGHFGDRLPKDVQTEMREQAVQERKQLDKMTNKVVKQLQ
jgi:hypothetical protein